MSRTVLKHLTGAVVICGLASFQGTTAECPHYWVSDGYCDVDCNTARDGWDGGDCCEDTCEDADYDCGYNGYDCQGPVVSRYLLEKEYSGFTLTLQCDKTANAGYAVGYAYNLTRDRADLGTKRSYPKDPSVPVECQQNWPGRATKLPSYKHPKCGQRGRQQNKYCFDRGHIVMGNQMDGTSETRRDAGYVTNLLPQSTGINQAKGSWKETEDIIECHRDDPEAERLEVFGGMSYEDDDNDYFVGSHGIPTPDLYWKVVVKYYVDAGRLPDVIAWVMENSPTDLATRLDAVYPAGDLISVARLRRLVGDPLNRLPPRYTQTALREGESWDRPGDCTRPISRDRREL